MGAQSHGVAVAQASGCLGPRRRAGELGVHEDGDAPGLQVGAGQLVVALRQRRRHAEPLHGRLEFGVGGGGGGGMPPPSLAAAALGPLLALPNVVSRQSVAAGPGMASTANVFWVQSGVCGTRSLPWPLKMICVAAEACDLSITGRTA